MTVTTIVPNCVSRIKIEYYYVYSVNGNEITHRLSIRADGNARARRVLRRRYKLMV